MRLMRSVEMPQLMHRQQVVEAAAAIASAASLDLRLTRAGISLVGTPLMIRLSCRRGMGVMDIRVGRKMWMAIVMVVAVAVAVGSMPCRIGLKSF